MKVLKEEINQCKCYGCMKKSTCQCINCGLKKKCKISFCMLEKLNQKTFECNICFTEFRTLDYLKKHRKKSNHWKSSTKNNEHLPKANWIDLYQCSARLLILILKFKTWRVKTRYWSWSQPNSKFKTSLGIGLILKWISIQVLVLVSKWKRNWDKSWYWSQKGINSILNQDLKF